MSDTSEEVVQEIKGEETEPATEEKEILEEIELKPEKQSKNKWWLYAIPYAMISAAVAIFGIAVYIGANVGKGVNIGQTAAGNDVAGTVVSGAPADDGDVTGTVADGEDAVGENGTSVGGGESTTVDGYTVYSIDGLSLAGSGYEGTEGTGNFNYGEALQKSILFYELQRSGKLPEGTRTNWRGDSCLNDGSDVGLDLTGGWFDAGDNVKFNLPMSYTATMLGWSIYEDRDAYVESGQLDYQLNNLRFVCDYFIKCHPEDEVYYYQVGDGGSDHGWWGPAELVEKQTNRPSYAVTASNPGSCVTGETAAALAVASIVFKDTDPDYSKLCLQHAESLYAFSEKYKSDSGYTAANGFYNSWSGFYDELAWAGAWLYLATDDSSYLDKAETYYPQAGQDYNWAMCWDDVHIGAAVLLAQITEKSTYTSAVEKHLDWWTTGVDGDRITYTPKGLAWLDNWGSLRYATTTAFIASVYSEWEGCPSSKVSTYWDFAVAQADYALGSTGRSFEVGFGENYPRHVHHRTAQGSYCNNMNEPGNARHVLVGALAGGPDAGDNYTDEVSNYNNNEVACDYNAGFTGLLAKLYTRYHGKTVIALGAVEEPGDEFFSEACVNVNGTDFVEIKAYVYNQSGWPARSSKDLELRYFIDLSEVYAAGGTASDIEITTAYIQNASSGGLVVWDEDSHIYYLSIKFEDGAVYPGGQENYKKEVQFRMRSLKGTWDNSNDFSYEGLSVGSMVRGTKLAVYENGKLVYGSEPAAGDHAGDSVGVGGSGGTGSGSTGGGADSGSGTGGTDSGSGSGAGTGGSTGGSGVSGTVPGESTATKGDLTITVKYNSTGSDANSISGTITIKNNGSTAVSLSGLKIKYYFTNEGGKTLEFACYHTAINGSSYRALSGCGGTFISTTENDSDTLCIISYTDADSIGSGEELTIQFCINHTDWSNMDMTNDYSALDAANIKLEF